jgi:hypothetical protein
LRAQPSDRLAAPYNPERVADYVFQRFNREFVNNGDNAWGLIAASYQGISVKDGEMQVAIWIMFLDGKTATLGINLKYDSRIRDSDVFRCNGTGVVRDGQVTHDYWLLQLATEVRFNVTMVPAGAQASTATPSGSADAYSASLVHTQRGEDRQLMAPHLGAQLVPPPKHLLAATAHQAPHGEGQATHAAVAGVAPQEGDAAPLLSALTVGLGETQKATNDATAQKAADAVWEKQSHGVLSSVGDPKAQLKSTFARGGALSGPRRFKQFCFR